MSAAGTPIATELFVKLKEEVQYALDEGRMLILGIQVLLGFDLQAFLMSGYDTLPAAVRVTKVINLVLLLLAVTLLLAPVARHRLVDDGRDTPRLYAFTRQVTLAALLPFALALGLDFYLVGVRVMGQLLGIVLAASAAVGALAAWYLLPWSTRVRELDDRSTESLMEPTELEDKIRHVLTEARVVLPGTQALLGFQFAGVLQPGFDSLPASSKILHIVALVSLGASVVFLMLPTAYHRIAERGEISERLHRFSSVAILLAMATLAVALATDAFITVRKATSSIVAAALVSGGWAVVSVGVWFVLMLVLRARHARQDARAARAARDAGGPPPETPESHRVLAT